jgi:hypothetical protein
MSLRFLCVVLAVMLGCGGDDDGSAEGGGGGGGGAGTSGAGAGGSAGTDVVTPPAPIDSGAEPVESPMGGAGGVDAGAIDAGTPDAAVVPMGRHCPDGEMPCDRDCIPVIEPTLEDLQKRVFGGSCGLSSSCHMGVSPKEGLDLSSAASTFSFVDEDSAQMPSAKLFDTKSPEDSYVLRKLRGMKIAEKASTGRLSTQMPPPPSAPLCEEKIKIIEDWVRAGAER